MKKKLPIGDFREVENTLNNQIDYKDFIFELAEKLLPFMKSDIKAGDMEKVLEKFTPIAFLKIADIAVNGKNERNQLSAALAMVDRAGYKPIERSINIEGDINHLTDNQLDSFLKNAWNRFPEEQKQKFVNLIEQPDGSYTVPEGNQIPSVLEEELPRFGSEDEELDLDLKKEFKG